MKRIGFHYFPDTHHYTHNDLNTWLPILDELNAGWLVLQAPLERAIPEAFLLGLLGAGIQPVLDFQLSPDQIPPSQEMAFLLKIYARWGIKYVTLFKKPNLRTSWESTNWAQTDLVERYLDIFLPQAETCLHLGMLPIFSPLEPGGDYWDTAFLRGALEGIQRRAYPGLVRQIIIGAVARTNGHALNWGSGGPERWPGAHPYFTPPHEEDQRGFRIFDWYNAYIEAVLLTSRSVFLFEMGATGGECDLTQDPIQAHLEMARLLDGKTVDGLEPLPNNIIGGAFWLLSAGQDDPHHAQTWFRASCDPAPSAVALKNELEKPSQPECADDRDPFPIRHYLLLPTYDGEISDAHFDLIRPFVKKHHPTIGFSLQEARQAQRVTILDGAGTYPDQEISQLRLAGCVVDQFGEDGIDIASP
jgi:hypothetical protein